jgi:hypothetical protein
LWVGPLSGLSSLFESSITLVIEQRPYRPEFDEAFHPDERLGEASIDRSGFDTR